MTNLGLLQFFIHFTDLEASDEIFLPNQHIHECSSLGYIWWSLVLSPLPMDADEKMVLH